MAMSDPIIIQEKTGLSKTDGRYYTFKKTYYTYERVGAVMNYVVYFELTVSAGYYYESFSVIAQMNGEEKRATFPKTTASGKSDAIRTISVSFSITTNNIAGIDGCTAWGKEFTAIVVPSIRPIYIKINGEIAQAHTAYACIDGAIRDGSVFVNVDGEIYQINGGE